ncbi:methylmalonyl-CoA epimerase [Halobacteriales archaeon QS_1_68_17]|nr:MAG: methylmalonyl-CoA epimerase [Halobacteriales archaeon QS_1_68_17]
MRFHHAGIATEDADDLAHRYTDFLPVPIAHRETFDGIDVVFLDLGGSYFELLEPRDGGAIADYLDSHGPGIHHLALATDDVSAALDAAREAGVDPIDDEPRPGAWGHDVAFLHPGSTGGVLLEFVQV